MEAVRIALLLVAAALACAAMRAQRPELAAGVALAAGAAEFLKKSVAQAGEHV